MSATEGTLAAAGFPCYCGRCCQAIEGAGDCPRCGPAETWPKPTAEQLASFMAIIDERCGLRKPPPPLAGPVGPCARYGRVYDDRHAQSLVPVGPGRCLR